MAEKKFRIQRTDPNHGVIYQKMWDGNEEPISTPMEYFKCMIFIQEKQKDLKTYRITRLYNRKNAKRHKAIDIYAEDNNEALEAFNRFLNTADDNITFELVTGDWHMIAIRRIGEPIIIL